MIQVNKNSFLATINTELHLDEIKSKIIREGLYFPYHPLGKQDEPLIYHVKNRTPNLYYPKYRSFADMISSVYFKIDQHNVFHLKDAPRAAIGPDFNRFVVGSGEHLGEVKDITIKLIAIPEKIVCGAFTAKSRKELLKFVTTCMGNFIEPLLFCEIKEKQLKDLLKTTKADKKFTNTDHIILFFLCGLKEMVDTEMSVVQGLCNQSHIDYHWFPTPHNRDILNDYIHNQEAYSKIQNLYSETFWNISDPHFNITLEKSFLNHIKQLQES